VSGVKRVALLALVATPLFAEPQMSFLDNGRVKVGVDLSLGGAITWLSRDGGENLVNSYDYGRQIQMSYYSGPVPFESGGQKPADHWRHLGWNPVQAGDEFKHGSKTLEHRNDGRTLYVKCIPLQWPLNNIPAECVFESWLELDGIALKARSRLTNARADKTRYPARHQEMPALYANAPFHRVVSYTGAKPFSGDAVQVIPKPQTKHPWAFWDATEQWSALLDKDDRGVGLIAPGVVRFTGGFAGKPGPNDPRGASTGYLAPLGTEIIDFNIVHEYRYEVVPGSLSEIRERAAKTARREPPAWSFENSRMGWNYANASDSGWPVTGMLNVNSLGNDPQLLSPRTFWNAEDAPVLTIEAAFKTADKNATVYWVRHGQSAPRGEDAISFPITGDGEMRPVRVRLADSKSYAGPMAQLRFDPVAKGAEGDWVKVRSIRLAKEQ
jgi:hypothetical protein